MKYLLLAACLIGIGATQAQAQKAGDFGAGVILGNPTGGTAKYWLSNSQALDFGLGYSSRFTIYGDYLWHAWDVLPQPTQGRLPIYLGLGAQFRGFDEGEVGLRTVAGVAYWLPRHPIEVFLEIVPVIRLTRTESVGLDAGAGLHVYFK